MGRPSDSVVEESTCQCRSCRRLRFDPWVRKIPWRREILPTAVFLPGKAHGQRSLAGYSAWDRRVRHNWGTEHTLASKVNSVLIQDFIHLPIYTHAYQPLVSVYFLPTYAHSHSGHTPIGHLLFPLTATLFQVWGSVKSVQQCVETWIHLGRPLYLLNQKCINKNILANQLGHCYIFQNYANSGWN